MILDHVESVVGKNVILKMKRNDYNFRYPHSSISVTAFLTCEDLIGQFDAAKEYASVDAGSGVEKVQKKNKVDLTFGSQLEDIFCNSH